jgi:hypothetical protein
MVYDLIMLSDVPMIYLVIDTLMCKLTSYDANTIVLLLLINV